MSTLLAAGIIAASVLLLCAVVWLRTGQMLDALARFSGAILATMTADDQLPIDPAAGRVLDARDLTDDELMAEVRRRNGGLHEAEEQP